MYCLDPGRILGQKDNRFLLESTTEDSYSGAQKSVHSHRSRSKPFRSENQKNKFAYFDETMIWEARKHIGASYFSIILAFYQDSILIWQA